MNIKMNINWKYMLAEKLCSKNFKIDDNPLKSETLKSHLENISMPSLRFAHTIGNKIYL